MHTLNNYKYRGARAMVILHEKHMRSCLAVWREAKEKNIKLPATDDSDYQSLDHLLHHVFRAARSYMVWMCDKLQLPDPQIDSVPELEEIENMADIYLKHLLERWALPLVDVEPERYGEMYVSNWKMEMCIEAMVEHAVMHPIRHEFQLQELLAKD